MSLTEILLSLEQQLLDPAVRRDAAALANLLADDFREFGSSGRTFTRSQIIAELLRESYAPPAIEDFEATLLAPELALVTYRTVRPGKTALRSSIWVHRENRWQVLFHQGTLVPRQ